MREKPRIVSENSGTYLHKRTVHFYVSLPENVRFPWRKRMFPYWKTYVSL